MLPNASADPGDLDLAATPSVGLTDAICDLTHELNNALLAVRGYATILHRSVTAPQQLADVDEIASAADRATDLTRTLATLVRSQDAVGRG